MDQSYFPFLPSMLLDYISCFLLQLGMAIWLKFGQLNMGGSDKYSF